MSTKTAPAALTLGLTYALLSGITLGPAASLGNAAEPGSAASLSTLFHQVSGTVTVLDEDTLEVSDFHYDGTGIVVRFYLAEDTSSFSSGIGIGPDLIGPPYNGETFQVEIPEGVNIHDYNAISVWCVAVGVSFGHGAFLSQPCNQADIAEPYTQLDIDDVLAFLDAFASGAPDADIAAPTGTLNIDDVLAFLDAFADGCA